jgi:hypothetical protein
MKILTAEIEGEYTPGEGWLTSAPKMIVGIPDKNGNPSWRIAFRPPAWFKVFLL